MEFRMYDNDTVKFEHEGDQFCLHVQQDDSPMNPRTDWDHPGTHMVCWHRRYNLGDEQPAASPEEFLEELKSTVEEGEIVMLPLYLLDHSGITISTRSFNDPWDSGQVGWIYTTKDEAIKEIGYGENDWRERAIQLMEAEVKEYDQYLTGDVYGFTLLKKVDVENEDDDSAWEEVDSCWGFYGSDVFESGMEDNVPGLRDALESGNYEEGEAKLVVTSHYTYPTKTR